MSGSSAIVHASIEALKTRQPEEFKRLFTDDHWLRLGLEAFEWRLSQKYRDATLAWLEAVGAIRGDQARQLVIFCGSLGVSDPEQVRRLVSMAKSADGATVEDSRRVAVQTLRGLMRADPSERGRLMQELFGMTEVAA